MAFLDAIQKKDEVNLTVTGNREVNSQEKPKKVDKPKRAPRKKPKVQVLTKQMVFDYIVENDKKWAGFGTLKGVICRHKAISTSVLEAIIDIHRNFKDCL
jgi:hypothetical protein